MREAIRLGFRLFLISLVAAALLAATNEITKEPIRLQAERAALEARVGALPGADEYEQLPLEAGERYPGVDQVYRATRAGQLEGYVLMITANGYKGPIEMTLSVGANGSIGALSITAQAESAGIGTRITEPEFLSQFPGAAADPDAIGGEVDAISGATVSSRAVISGVETALRYVRDELGLEPAAEEGGGA